MKDGPTNKMTKMAKFIANFGYEGVDHIVGTRALSVPRHGRQKTGRARMGRYEFKYKSATSGFPRSTKPCGSIPAPTLDQVRRLERAYMTRLHVKLGLLYFKSDGTIFTKESAMARRQEKMQGMVDCCC